MSQHLWTPGTCSRGSPCIIETPAGGQRNVIRYLRRCRHHFALVETRTDGIVFDEIVTETREQRPSVNPTVVRPDPPPREDVPPRVR